jgi:hypothetical protein
MKKSTIIKLVKHFKYEILYIVLVISGTLLIGNKVIPYTYSKYLNSKYAIDNITEQKIDTTKHINEIRYE